VQGFTEYFVAPLMRKRGWQRICEIGSCLGEGTGLLRGIPDLQVTVIDPCLDCDLEQKFSHDQKVNVRKGLSLAVLPNVDESFNCILIDGDHNWYTVYNELKLISDRQLLKKGGFIFLHDVEWPWGRRDMYYQPETIPPEFRHRWEQQGIVRGESELSDVTGSFADVKKATSEGGKRNGVLTAIEDFLRERKGAYRFFCVNVGYGLGVMQYRGGFRDDLSFLALAVKGAIFEFAYRVKEFTGLRVPSSLQKGKR
jgi:predicted O-methyltransferase YrrM